jgi:hypothetical protein
MSSPPQGAAAPWGWRLANAALLVLLVLLLAAVGSELISYLQSPGDYFFGTEVGGWLYRSSRHYVGGLLAQAVVLVGGIVLSLLERQPGRVMLIRLLSLLLEGAILLAAALWR